jgi:hypothetical protein
MTNLTYQTKLEIRRAYKTFQTILATRPDEKDGFVEYCLSWLSRHPRLLADVEAHRAEFEAYCKSLDKERPAQAPVVKKIGGAVGCVYC